VKHSFLVDSEPKDGLTSFVGHTQLDFIVHNQLQDYGNPTGLRVAGGVSAHAVPEPSSALLMRTSCSVGCGYAYRMRNRSVI
jgi:hypothetical protein